MPIYRGQYWFLTKAQQLGYSEETLGGHCFAMSEMAISACLLDDYKTFEARLHVINQLTDKDIEAIKSNWTIKKETLEDGREVTVSEVTLSNGTKINPVDILAFFDGLRLFQSGAK